MVTKVLTLGGMLATVAWFFWNPTGWVLQWEPIVVFLALLAGYIAVEKTSQSSKGETTKVSPHPNDVLLYNKFLETLPSNTFIEFLKQHDFLIDFNPESIAPLSDFIYEWNNAEHEFQDGSLEAHREKLMEAAVNLSNKISKYTVQNKSGLLAVRVQDQKHIEEHEQRFREEAKLINEAADQFIELHQNLVREGRTKCNV